MTTLVTSLNQKLFEEYGEAMLDGFQRFSRDVTLILAFEGGVPRNLRLKTHLVKVIKLKSPKYDRFHASIGKLYEANGMRLFQFQA